MAETVAETRPVAPGPGGPDIDAGLMGEVRQQLHIGKLFRSVPLPAKNYNLPVSPAVPVQGTPPLWTQLPDERPDEFWAHSYDEQDLASGRKPPRLVAEMPVVRFAARRVGVHVHDEVGIGCAHSTACVAENAASAIDRAIVVGNETANPKHLWNGLLYWHGEQESPATVDLCDAYWKPELEEPGYVFCNAREARRRIREVANRCIADKLPHLKRLMGKFGTNPREGAWVTSIAGYIKLLGLDECLTLDKYGPNAVIFDGELAQLFGSPVLASDDVPQDDDSTVVLYVYRPGFLLGWHSGEYEANLAVVELDFRPARDPRVNHIVGVAENLPCEKYECEST